MPTLVNGPRRDSTEGFDTDIITLPRFIIEHQKQFKNATGDFTLVLNALQFAFKFVSHTIRRAELVNLVGLAGASNFTGDQQKKLDVLGDEIFINAMRASGIIKVLVSEEQEDLIVFPQTQAHTQCVVILLMVPQIWTLVFPLELSRLYSDCYQTHQVL